MSGRGSYGRSRRGRGRAYGSSHREILANPHRWKEDLEMEEGPIWAISAEEHASADGPPVRFHCERVVATYTWRDAPSPTIVVPGLPPRLRDPLPETPFQLDLDSGGNVIDENARRVPDAPFVPMVVAMRVYRDLGPAPSPRPATPVTDRNNLRKLLAFVAGEPWYDDNMPLRMDLGMVGGALVVLRREPRSWGEGHPGYGTAFKQYVTQPSPGGQGRPGYKRVVRGRLGPADGSGLGLLVRYDADAVVAGESVAEAEGGVDDLSAAMFGLGLSEQAAGAGVSDLVAAEVVGDWGQAGWASVEMASRSYRKDLDAGSKWSQMALSGTEWLVHGRHDRGVFASVEQRSPGSLEEEVAPRVRDPTKGLLSLLRELAELVEQVPEERIAVVWREPKAPLELYGMRGGAPGLSDSAKESLRAMPEEDV